MIIELTFAQSQDTAIVHFLSFTSFFIPHLPEFPSSTRLSPSQYKPYLARKIPKPLALFPEAFSLGEQKGAAQVQEVIPRGAKDWPKAS